MSTPWLRLWTEMPTDIKFGTIATKSGQSVSEVQAVYLQLLVNASNNDDNRGSLHHFYADDVADYLRIKTEQVEAILTAMQGKLLDGDKLMGWESRQPKREDGSAERAKANRDAQKQQTAHLPVDNRTQPQPTAKNAPEVDADTDKDNTAHAACGQLPACGQLIQPPTPAAPVEPVESPQVEIFDDRQAVALAVCAALKACGINHVSPSNTQLTTLVQRGADVQQFTDAANKAKAKGKGLAYLLGTVRGQLDDAQRLTTEAMSTAAAPWRAPARGPEFSPSRIGPDPALAKIDADRLVTGPPPAHIRAILAELSKKIGAKA